MLQSLDIITTKHVPPHENYFETYIEISTMYEFQRLFSLLHGDRTLLLVKYLFKSLKDIKGNIFSRTRCALALKSVNETLLDKVCKSAKNFCGFIVKDKLIAVDLAFMYTVPHLLRGAVIISEIDQYREHWLPDGGLNKADESTALLCIDGERIDLESLCTTCPLAIHRATGGCRLLGPQCLMAALKIFDGSITKGAGEGMHALNYTGILNPRWFTRHRMDTTEFKGDLEHEKEPVDSHQS